ncbi:hypothetical protein CN398_05225 [Bacillus thuringiensis]|uniref:Uncharacterized protein n=2 Tax=Bacillus TaxID=1386 RepID=A0A9X6VE42_BACTU|nr:hypothetical protein CN398_05225 [Bacillus thuringiensis]
MKEDEYMSRQYYGIMVHDSISNKVLAEKTLEILKDNELKVNYGSQCLVTLPVDEKYNFKVINYGSILNHEITPFADETLAKELSERIPFQDFIVFHFHSVTDTGYFRHYMNGVLIEEKADKIEGDNFICAQNLFKQVFGIPRYKNLMQIIEKYFKVALERNPYLQGASYAHLLFAQEDAFWGNKELCDAIQEQLKHPTKQKENHSSLQYYLNRYENEKVDNRVMYYLLTNGFYRSATLLDSPHQLKPEEYFEFHQSVKKIA